MPAEELKRSNLPDHESQLNVNTTASSSLSRLSMRGRFGRQRSVGAGPMRHCAACYQQHRLRQRAREPHWRLMLDLYEYHRVAMRLLFDRAPLQQIESGIVELWKRCVESLSGIHDCDRCK